MTGFVRGERGQGLVEFALILPPILIILVFGLVEVAWLMSDSMTMASATREGARVGGALVNGGGALGCQGANSPNWQTVDPNIIAAVQRVLTGTGSGIQLADVNEILIWKSTATGDATNGKTNTWNYQPGGGPVVDGQPLNFDPHGAGQNWKACDRTYVALVDSVGVTVSYTYRARTPLRFFFPFFNQIVITDHAVMSMNVAK